MKPSPNNSHLRYRFGWLALAVAVLRSMPGCWVFSVAPLDEDPGHSVRDLSVAGDWWQPELGCTLSIKLAEASPRPGTGHYYNISYAAPAWTGSDCLIDVGVYKFKGLLFQVGEGRFLDLMPDLDDKKPNHPYFMPVHSFHKVVVKDKRLSLVPISSKWILERSRAKTFPLRMRDEFGDKWDVIVLTASSEEIRTFLRAHENYEKTFAPEPSFTFEKH